MEDNPKRKVVEVRKHPELVDLSTTFMSHRNQTHLKSLLEVADGDRGRDGHEYKLNLGPFIDFWAGTGVEKTISPDVLSRLLHLVHVWPEDKLVYMLDLYVLLEYSWELTTGITHKRRRSSRVLKMDSSKRRDVLAAIR